MIKDKTNFHGHSRYMYNNIYAFTTLFLLTLYSLPCKIDPQVTLFHGITYRVLSIFCFNLWRTNVTLVRAWQMYSKPIQTSIRNSISINIMLHELKLLAGVLMVFYWYITLIGKEFLNPPLICHFDVISKVLILFSNSQPVLKWSWNTQLKKNLIRVV